MSITVIIPFRRINAYVRESLPLLLALRHASLDVILLPDEVCSDDYLEHSDRVAIAPTGPMGPAQKRDVGAQLARGEILAFLDDDAFPDHFWLGAALPHFALPNVAAVGGPSLTPARDSFSRQASGWALATWIGSGAARMRYFPVGGAREVDDWPSVNLLVRRSDFLAVGGFDCSYFPGEDTKLCLDITSKLGKRIIYEPRAIVYHHRRNLLPDHFLQIGQYAVHRGFFAKAYPRTSLRLSYFMPSLFVAGLVAGGLGALISSRLRLIYTGTIVLYLGVVSATGASIGVRTRRPLLGMVAALAVIGTHIWYGLSFMRGFATRNLKH